MVSVLKLREAVARWKRGSALGRRDDRQFCLSARAADNISWGKIKGRVSFLHKEMEDSGQQWTKYYNLTIYNFTSTDFQDLENLNMKLGVRILWDILFISLILVGVAGNLMVLWIVTGKNIDRFFKAACRQWMLKFEKTVKFRGFLGNYEYIIRC